MNLNYRKDLANNYLICTLWSSVAISFHSIPFFSKNRIVEGNSQSNFNLRSSDSSLILLSNFFCIIEFLQNFSAFFASVLLSKENLTELREGFSQNPIPSDSFKTAQTRTYKTYKNFRKNPGSLQVHQRIIIFAYYHLVSNDFSLQVLKSVDN